VLSLIVAAEGEITIATGDIDLRVPSSNSKTATLAGDLDRRSVATATTVAGKEPVGKVAEKQRIMSLIGRVTEMLRSGKLGPITPHDVRVTKRNFSDGAGEGLYDRNEKDIDARDFGHIGQSQKCVSVTHSQYDDLVKRSVKNLSVAVEPDQRSSANRSLICTEAHLDNSHDRDDRQNLLDCGNSMDRVLNEYRRSTFSAVPKVADSLGSGTRKVVFKDCSTDLGESTTLKNGLSNSGYTDSSSIFSGDPFKSQDVDLRNMSSPASHDVDLRDRLPLEPKYVCRVRCSYCVFYSVDILRRARGEVLSYLTLFVGSKNQLVS